MNGNLRGKSNDNDFKRAVHIMDIKTIAKLKTWFILDKQKRRAKRNEIIQNYNNKQRSLKKAEWENLVRKTAKSVGEGLYCGGYCIVNKNTILADHVSMNGLRVSGNGNIKIGRYFHSGIEILIIAQNHNYDEGEMIPYDTTYKYKDIEIGDFVWLGSRVMILPGTKIGEGAIIQGGAVVHGEIPPYAIAGGNPAKVFKYRNIEHFKKLKAEGKFYG